MMASNDGAPKEQNPAEIDTQEQASLRDTYPDTAAIFSFRLAPLEEIKDECYVVLDTNALVLPYTISPKNLEEIKRTYTLLSRGNRLKIPAQVAREFAKIRALKLGELNQQLSDKKSLPKQLSIGGYPLLESIPEYATVLEMEKDINAKLREYQNALGHIIDKVRAWRWDDPVSDLYRHFFTAEAIIETPLNAQEIASDVKRRNDGKIPPGYKDASKGVNIAGDLEIWHTIHAIGKINQKSIIFVSGDEKVDWWHRSAGQKLYPRYELVDEFRRASDGQSFHMVQLSDLLDLYGAGKQAVDELRREEAVTWRNIANTVSRGGSELRFDGLYEAPLATSTSQNSSTYLRFYKNGYVAAATSMINYAAFVAPWLSIEHADVSKGTFTVDGEVLLFTVTSKYGVVEYSGIIGHNSLALEVYSHITNYRANQNFRFVPDET